MYYKFVLLVIKIKIKTIAQVDLLISWPNTTIKSNSTLCDLVFLEGLLKDDFF